MAKDRSNSDRLYVEGIQSFVKGCDQFFARPFLGYEGISQFNESPSIYTRLSCFLPWVAEQYGLYHPESQERECRESRGSREVSEECRTNPEGHTHFARGIFGEERCIFPFYYKGQLYNECIVSPTSDFVFQVVCPVRNSTSKMKGINNYGDGELLPGFCLKDQEVILEASDNCERIQVFPQCKNNCPGGQSEPLFPPKMTFLPSGRGFGIVGGGSLVATAAAISAVSVLSSLPLPSLAGIGKITQDSAFF